MSQDDVNQVVAEHGMKRFTDKTITELPALFDELSHVRRDGYSIDREEFISGVICVAAAIRDHAGAVLGAIGASTPAMRASEQHLALSATRSCRRRGRCRSISARRQADRFSIGSMLQTGGCAGLSFFLSASGCSASIVSIERVHGPRSPGWRRAGPRLPP